MEFLGFITINSNSFSLQFIDLFPILAYFYGKKDEQRVYFTSLDTFEVILFCFESLFF